MEIDGDGAGRGCGLSSKLRLLFLSLLSLLSAHMYVHWVYGVRLCVHCVHGVCVCLWYVLLMFCCVLLSS